MAGEEKNLVDEVEVMETAKRYVNTVVKALIGYMQERHGFPPESVIEVQLSEAGVGMAINGEDVKGIISESTVIAVDEVSHKIN